MRQLFLDEVLRRKNQRKSLSKITSQIQIINWNIAHPSLFRAKKIVSWLEERPENIFILTETADSFGCRYLSDRLESLGFQIIFPKKEKDFGAMLAFKGFGAKEFKVNLDFLPNRSCAIICLTPIGELIIIGVYIPSSVSRNETYGKKERFQKEFTKTTASEKDKDLIVCGDLNVLEPNHHPRYSFLKPWEYEFYNSFAQNQMVDAFRLLHPTVHEYSWFGREGYGYRYDHCFVSKKLSKYVRLCRYLHEPREKNLSDHSAMLLELDLSSLLTNIYNKHIIQL